MNDNKTISQRYLSKLGINDQNFQPTLDSLNKILELHVQNLAFGNINSFLGENVELDIETIADKLLSQEREGYCVEHALLSKAVLTELGYEAFNVLCRVYYKAQPTEPPFKTHLVTFVHLNNSLYLFDPGFGGMTPSSILSVYDEAISQTTQNEPFRIIKAHKSGFVDSAIIDQKYMLQVNIAGQWENIYGFDPEQIAAFTDIKVANWYVSTHPSSGFTQNLMITIVKPNERFNLSNGTMKIYKISQNSEKLNEVEQKIVHNIDEFSELLISVFKINPLHLNVQNVVDKIQFKVT